MCSNSLLKICSRAVLVVWRLPSERHRRFSCEVSQERGDGRKREVVGRRSGLKEPWLSEGHGGSLGVKMCQTKTLFLPRHLVGTMHVNNDRRWKSFFEDGFLWTSNGWIYNLLFLDAIVFEEFMVNRSSPFMEICWAFEGTTSVRKDSGQSRFSFTTHGNSVYWIIFKKRRCSKMNGGLVYTVAVMMVQISALKMCSVYQGRGASE
ncbi:hypothetical protein V6N12_053511 [Hibiscus sabdariffa]|uniref:Uncharacterized protein n=1 Tax=Hibiscus sabdariffa TaxID=183260 RepID=A0ABR2D9G1_9ROSI